MTNWSSLKCIISQESSNNYSPKQMMAVSQTTPNWAWHVRYCEAIQMCQLSRIKLTKNLKNQPGPLSIFLAKIKPKNCLTTKDYLKLLFNICLWLIFEFNICFHLMFESNICLNFRFVFNICLYLVFELNIFFYVMFELNICFI